MAVSRVRLLVKYLVQFDVRLLSGLHIGGNDSGGGIGDIDATVIRDPLTDYPYISGSSLKGRMRERLEWLHVDSQHQSTAVEYQIAHPKDDKLDLNKISACNCGQCDICHYFGHSNHKEESVILGPTRITVRDAMPKRSDDSRQDQIQIWESKLGKHVYHEVKTENTINRITAVANPRSMERVPAGSCFRGEIVLDCFTIQISDKEMNDDPSLALKLLFKGLCLIEESYLGGKGSRGSGRVIFERFSVRKRTAEYYENPQQGETPFKIDAEKSAADILNEKLYESFV